MRVGLEPHTSFIGVECRAKCTGTPLAPLFYFHIQNFVREYSQLMIFLLTLFPYAICTHIAYARSLGVRDQVNT